MSPNYMSFTDGATSYNVGMGLNWGWCEWHSSHSLWRSDKVYSCFLVYTVLHDR